MVWEHLPANIRNHLIGILTFFYLLYHAIRSAPDMPIQDRDIRIAITGSITTMYLALVGFGVFMRIPEVGEKEAPLAQSLVVSFTSVVGIVIAFYFGTTAYLEGKNAGSPAPEPKTEQPRALEPKIEHSDSTAKRNDESA